MSNRIWKFGTAVVCLAIIGLGLVLGILPEYTKSQKNDADRAAVEAQNAVYQADLTKLQAEFAGLSTIEAELAKLRETLPPELAYTAFLRQLDSLAIANGVTISTSERQNPVAYGDFSSGVAGAPADAAAVKGGTLLGIPVSLTLSADDPMRLFDFITGLQHGQRLYLPTSFTLSSTSAGKSTLYTLVVPGLIYTLTDPSAVLVEPAPAETPTETPTETPAPTDTSTPPAVTP